MKEAGEEALQQLIKFTEKSLGIAVIQRAVLTQSDKYIFIFFLCHLGISFTHYPGTFSSL